MSRTAAHGAVRRPQSRRAPNPRTAAHRHSPGRDRRTDRRRPEDRHPEASITPTYRVLIEWDGEGSWIASVPSVAGCHTFGPSIALATRRIRTALGLFVPDAGSAVLQVRLHIPQPLQRLVAAANHARTRLKIAQRHAAETTARAVAGATEAGMSRRDVAELLQLSPQRVQQLVDRGGVRPHPR